VEDILYDPVTVYRMDIPIDTVDTPLSKYLSCFWIILRLDSSGFMASCQGLITWSGDSVLGRDDRVQIISGAQPTSYSMDAGVLSRR
jgi:hypothetical protein